MLEYAVKKIITNPTLMTKTSDIIKIVDNRSHQTKAFILPVSYEPLIDKLEKEKKFKKWVENKKEELKKSNNLNDDVSDVMKSGIDSINEYLS